MSAPEDAPELHDPPELEGEPPAEEPRPGPPPAAAEPAMLPLVYHERTLIVGTTRCGKSVLAQLLVSELRTRVLVIDPKGEGAEPYGARLSTREVQGWLDTTPTPRDPIERVVRWVPASGTPDEYEAIYQAAHRHRGPLVVQTDELYGPGTAQTAPRHLRLYLTQGGGLGHGHIGLTQRPANICMEARTEWSHLVVFTPPPDPDDLRSIAKSTGIDLAALQAELATLPEHGFVWVDRTTRERLVSDPVPIGKGRIY